MAIDGQQLQDYLGRFVLDLGATMYAADVVIGDRLGLYKALAMAGPSTAAELADRTNTAARYVEEWLRGQADGGYVTYDPDTRRYELDEIQVFTLTNESAPPFLPGAFHAALGAVCDEPAISEAFRTGEGVAWHEHDGDVFERTERVLRTAYDGHLIDSWPARLRRDRRTAARWGYRGRHRLRPQSVRQRGPRVWRVAVPWVRVPRRLRQTDR
jgi:hypothetical protein